MSKGIDNYEVLAKIGYGGYGIVFKGKNKKTGNYVALKQVPLDVDDKGIPPSIIREISLLKLLEHPNIMHLDNVFVEPSAIYLVFELMDRDLKQFIKSLDMDKFLEPMTVKSYLYQINSAVLYCHKRRIMHRDIKPHNLLINGAGIIKLTDFGLGRAGHSSPRPYTQKLATLWYRAPEMLLRIPSYSYPVDIWSLGCTFAEMVTKVPLFLGFSEIDQMRKIFSILCTPTEETWPGVSELPIFQITFPQWDTNRLHERVLNLDEDGLDLLQNMLLYDQAQRINADLVRQHRYFHDVVLPPALPR